MNRRKFLKIAGGAGVVLAAGVGGFLATRTADTALAPWKQAGTTYADPMRKALSYALLAPNPHNRQPWQIDLTGDTEGMLICDLDRRLPATDPFDRQIVIGLGCFLELFDLAAREDGFRAEINLFPQGMPAGDREGRLDDSPIAHLKLVKDPSVTADPLFTHCLNRRTNRGAYDVTKTVSQRLQDSIVADGSVSLAGPTASGGMGFVTQSDPLSDLNALTIDAMIAEANNHEAHMESINLMRIGVSEVESNPDGISLYGPLFDSLKLVGALHREGLSDPDSAMFKSGVEPMIAAASSTPAYVWISTQGNDRLAQIAAGRSYMRTCLSATSHSLSMQPVSQALQEYSDMDALYHKLHKMIAPDDGSRVQMLCRIGYGETVAPTPRWSLETRLKT